jgi:hypothetical protein
MSHVVIKPEEVESDPLDEGIDRYVGIKLLAKHARALRVFVC